MPQETLGYVQLEWTCPKCSSRNPGTLKTCQSCGGPQPDNVQFQQVEGQALSQDESLKKAAEAGPDIHCPYCGARNPGGTAICSQCGGDLKEGARREVGRVVGAYAPGEVRQVPCPRCGSANPETNLKCAACGAPLAVPQVAAAAPAPLKPTRLNWVWIAAGAVVLLCLCVGAVIFSRMAFSGSDSAGVVQAVEWRTVVQVEQLGPASRQGWRDQVPNGASLGDCQDQVRYTQDNQPSGGNYNKVCGTPYTVDTGSGVGKVVQDCRFEVLEPYCQYTVQEWRVAEELEQTGQDFTPIFAQPQLQQGQRLGQQQAKYVVLFETGEDRYEYTLSSLEEFQQFQVGSRWTLTINGFNQIIGVEPAR